MKCIWIPFFYVSHKSSEVSFCLIKNTKNNDNRVPSLSGASACRPPPPRAVPPGPGCAGGPSSSRRPTSKPGQEIRMNNYSTFNPDLLLTLLKFTRNNVHTPERPGSRGFIFWPARRIPLPSKNIKILRWFIFLSFLSLRFLRG